MPPLGKIACGPCADAQAFLIDRAETEEERYRAKFAEGVALFDDLFARTEDLVGLTEIRATLAVIDLAGFLTVNAPISTDDLKLITFDLVKQPKQDSAAVHSCEWS